MAADIVKTTQHAIVAAYDDERLSHKVKGKVIARLFNLADMTDNLPGCSK
jgi:hypothetical protein